MSITATRSIVTRDHRAPTVAAILAACSYVFGESIGFGGVGVIARLLLAARL